MLVFKDADASTESRQPYCYWIIHFFGTVIPLRGSVAQYGERQEAQRIGWSGRTLRVIHEEWPSLPYPQRKHST